MDKVSINRKYNYLIERLDRLKKYLEDYDNTKKQRDKEILYYALQRVTEETVETAIKINIFILKEINIFPKSYQDSFLQLKEFEFEEKELEELAKTAKFRNILAHEYIDLKEEDFIKNSKKILKLYPKYLKKIYKMII